MSQSAEPGQQPPEHSGPRKVALAMFGLLLVTYTLMAADRYLVSMLGTDIRSALGLTLPQMGALTTMFTLGIGIAGLPAGALIAKYSRKAVLILGVLLFSIATLLFTQATGFASMFVFIVMQGVGMSFLATSMFSLSASYFSANRVAALGIVNVCFGIGSFIGPWSIGNIRASSGNWETPMLVFGIIGIVIAVVIALTVRPWFSETKVAAKHLEDTGGAETLKNHNTIIFVVLSALYGVIIYGFLGLYPTFMVDVLSLEHSDVGGVMKFFGLGSLLAFFGGKLGDRYPTKIVLSSSSLVMMVLGYFLYLPDLSMGMYKFMAFMVGVFGASIVYTNLAGGHIKSLRRTLTSKGSSMFVTSIYGGAALGGFLMGELIHNYGWEIAGLVQISLLSLISAILVQFVRPGEFSK